MRRFLASFKRGRRERSKNWWEKESLLQINFYTEGREERERKKEKSSLLVPRKKPPPVGGREKEAFLLPVRWGRGWRVASGANMKRGKKAFFFPFLSLSLSSILLVIADNGYLVSVSVEWTMISWRERERENGNRNILLRGKIYSKTIVIPLLVAGGIVTQTRYGWKMILKKKG